jgi:hypothetical protein
VFTTLTLTGVSLTDATNPTVWSALRRSYTCNTIGLPPSLAIVVSISDGRTTMSYSAADSFNNPGIGGTSCARRRLQVTDGGSSTGPRQLQSGGGNLTVVLRMSIPASAVASASPAPGQSVNEAQALAQVTLVNSFIARTANTGTWLRPEGLFTGLLTASASSSQSAVMPSPAPAAAPSGSTSGSGSGSGSGSSAALAAGVGAGVGALLAVGAAAAALLYLRRRSGAAPAGAPGGSVGGASEPSQQFGNPMVGNPMGAHPRSGGTLKSVTTSSGRQVFATQQP